MSCDSFLIRRANPSPLDQAPTKPERPHEPMTQVATAPVRRVFTSDTGTIRGSVPSIPAGANYTRHFVPC